MLKVATDYAQSIVDGRRPAGKWIYAAAKRFLADLERADIYFDAAESERMGGFFGELTLIGDSTGEPFALAPWQQWAIANLYCWRNTDDNERRVSNGLLQVGRGNGKTTLMAGLCLYDLLSGSGRRVHCVANRVEQGEILLDTAREMAKGLGDRLKTYQFTLEDRDHDCIMSVLPCKASSLDGLTPSLWIADEAAEFKGRFLSKLVSAGAKRKSCLGVIISTPADNPDGIYHEKVTHAEAILRGDIVDDSTVAMLYGIDAGDSLEDEEGWLKANPGAEYGQPAVKSIRRAWTSAKTTPMGRSEFARYNCCRMTDSTGGWLDMSLWPAPTEIDWESLRGRPAWVGLDLSKSLDMTALVIAVPLEDGAVALRGHYWWPDADVKQRELDYRLPVRTWALDGHIELTPGRDIDYHAVLAKLVEIAGFFSVQTIAFDRWGSTFFAESCVNEGLPLATYSQGIATMGPGCQLWQQYWVGNRLRVGNDPVLRNACRTAIPIRDTNGNIKIDKRIKSTIIDPLVAAIMALHAWGGEARSVYEEA